MVTETSPPPRRQAEARTQVLARLGLDPGAAAVMRLPAPLVDERSIELPYVIDGVGEFVERFEFTEGAVIEPQAPGLAAAVDALHVLAGVSYYKAVLPERLVVERALDPLLVELAGSVYTEGLGEFAYRNGIELDPLRLESPPADGSPSPTVSPGPVTRPLVPIGGGKDSIVTVEAIRSHGDPVLFGINPRGPILRTVSTSGLPHIAVRRTLPDALFDLNERGAWNGHVPVTAIVSGCATVAAVAAGCDAVVMSNERSADAGNVELDGRSVNHQWSKSSAFEHAFAELVRSSVDPALRYVSFLRSVSELAIARVFARQEAYLDEFNSCNRAFHLRGSTQEWCGECPKCRFVFLVLAPFLDRERLVGIFGRNLLADAAAVPRFAELLGRGDVKPWECVGEVEESQAAMDCLATTEWADDVVVAELGRPDRGCGALERWAAAPGSDDLPPPLDAAFHATF